MKNGLFHKKQPSGTPSRCLKITEKVSFNITIEASYVFILSEEKFVENANKKSIWRVFEKLTLAVKQYYQSILMGQKLVENAKIQKRTLFQNVAHPNKKLTARYPTEAQIPNC